MGNVAYPPGIQMLNNCLKKKKIEIMRAGGFNKSINSQKYSHMEKVNGIFLLAEPDYCTITIQ